MAQKLGTSGESVEDAYRRYDTLLNQRRSELIAAANTDGPYSLAVLEPLRTRGNMEKQYDVMQGAVGGRPADIKQISQMWFWSGIALIGIAEIAANKILFDMLFLGSAAKSIIIALMLAGVLVFVAHFAGSRLRQVWSDSERHIVWERLVWSLAALGTLIFVVLGLMVAREHFATSGATTSGIDVFGEIAKRISEDGFWGTIAKAFGNVEALSLGAFNLVCLLVALIIGYITHDRDVHYDNAFHQLRAAEQKHQSALKKYQKMKSNILKKYAPRLELASKSFSRALAFSDQNGDEIKLPDDNFADQVKIAEDQSRADAETMLHAQQSIAENDGPGTTVERRLSADDTHENQNAGTPGNVSKLRNSRWEKLRGSE